MNNKLFKILGRIISVLCIVFILSILIKFDIDFSLLLDLKVIGMVLICAIIFALSVFIDSYSWKMLLTVSSDIKIPIIKITDVYTTSNLAKYLPGNVMHYASRNLLGAKYNISQKHMAYATILEIILKAISAMIISIILLNKALYRIILDINQNMSLRVDYLIICIILVSVVIIGFILKKYCVNTSNGIKAIIISILNYICTFLISSGIFIAITYVIGAPLTMGELMYAGGIYIGAWLVGYITPGAPGGVGVKEGSLIMMLSGIYTIESITLISIVTRIVTILGDVVAYSIAKILDVKTGATL